MPVLHLIEDLRLALEMLALPQEREALLSQIPGPTAAYIKEWFEDSLVSWTMGIVGHLTMQQWNATSGQSQRLLPASPSPVLLPT